MKNSMQHWNGKQVCAMDVETTGLDPHYHEIIQVCLLPLDSNIEIRRDILPLNMFLKPDYPQRADRKAMKVNCIDMANLVARGFDREKAKDLLIDWIDKLGMPCNKYGNKLTIIPLGQNLSFDISFMKRWLGDDLYSEYFHYHYKDTMISASYINDHAAMHGEKVLFPKINLKYLANILNVDIIGHHDALVDCKAAADVYRKMLQRGLI